MCVNCIRNEVDITEGIPKQATLHFCRNCERYPPTSWFVGQRSIGIQRTLDFMFEEIEGSFQGAID